MASATNWGKIRDTWSLHVGGTVRWCNTSRFFLLFFFFLPVVVVPLKRERKLSRFIPALLSISFMIHTLSPHLPIKVD